MSQKIALIDYGMGNIASVQRALEVVGATSNIVQNASGLNDASLVVLPGVGAFDHAVRELRSRKLLNPIRDWLARGKPYLGMCLGLQLLFEGSDEGLETGLSFFKGRCVRFPSCLKTPHMGWNKTDFLKPFTRFSGQYFYYVHSFYITTPHQKIGVGRTRHTVEFISCIRKSNVIATQFHPEKSQDVGLDFLRMALRELKCL